VAHDCRQRRTRRPKVAAISPDYVHDAACFLRVFEQGAMAVLQQTMRLEVADRDAKSVVAVSDVGTEQPVERAIRAWLLCEGSGFFTAPEPESHFASILKSLLH
jgi:hypothetical protein